VLNETDYFQVPTRLVKHCCQKHSIWFKFWWHR